MSGVARRGYVLSSIDRKLLKLMLSPNGRFSSKDMAKKLGIPETTVQRHRKRLEKEFLRSAYTLDLEKFGWHRVDFFVATERGMTSSVGKKAMEFEEVVQVGRSIGQQTIDLHIQAILKGNSEILMMMEKLKSMEGIHDVIWSEVVEVVGRKVSIPNHIIDQL